MSKQLQEKPNPKTTSSDYRAMADFWKMVGAILHGVEALRSTTSRGGKGAIAGPVIPYASLQQLDAHRRGRSAVTSPYLPQYPNETNEDYDYRRKFAPLTNIYNDISKNLASKPFSKTLTLAEGTPDNLVQLADNIDGQGNNLHVFAASVFKDGIDKAIDWILIDYNKVTKPATLADERAMGLRPYWVHIAAERLLAVYSDFLNGVEIITHARIYEPSTVRDGYDEDEIERVRIFDRAPSYNKVTGVVESYADATWQLMELQESEDPASKETQEWVMIDSGAVSIGIIPLVPFKTGKRDGSSWKIAPPLKDIAYMQIEEFNQESNLQTIKTLTAFPMLSGDGVSPPTNSDGTKTVVPVGPRSVLFAPMSNEGRPGNWHFIEPTAQSLTFLKADLDGFRDQMRDLGMQPLATANLTVITTANVSMKAHNAVQAWALALKDALEQAWKITALWLNQPNANITVNVHTDFGVDFEAGTELVTLQLSRAAKDLSQQTYWEELKRRGVLSDDFDPDEELKLLAEEQSNEMLTPETHIDPKTGMPIIVQPAPGVLNPKPAPVIVAPGNKKPIAGPPASVN